MEELISALNNIEAAIWLLVVINALSALTKR